MTPPSSARSDYHRQHADSTKACRVWQPPARQYDALNRIATDVKPVEATEIEPPDKATADLTVLLNAGGERILKGSVRAENLRMEGRPSARGSGNASRGVSIENPAVERG